MLAAWYPIKHGVATQRFLERVRRAGLKRSLAVELAESAGLTLVAFLRGARFNVYGARERIA